MTTLTPKGNLPKAAPRWSLSRAALEIGVSRETIKAGLADNRTKPGPDNCYSTKELMAAVFGGLGGEKLRKVKETADNSALRNQASREAFIPAKDVWPAIQAVFLAIEGEILESKLDEDTKKSIIKHLHQFTYSPRTPEAPSLIRATSLG